MSILRTLREKHGVSQEEMAVHLKISRSAVSLKESGKRPVTREDVREYADCFTAKREEEIRVYLTFGMLPDWALDPICECPDDFLDWLKTMPQAL